MRSRFASASVARLATVGADGRPHIVPVCFVIDEQTLYFAVDAKPKRTTNLKRLRNIAANPAVSILVDHYEDDWSALWWVRVDGDAMVVSVDAEDGRLGLSALAAKYPQYAAQAPPGPLIRIVVDNWTSWSSRD